MFEEDFQIKYQDTNLLGEATEICKNVTDIFEDKVFDRISPMLSRYLENPRIRAFILFQKDGNKKVGFILFNSWRILFLFLLPSITERKIPAFLLTGAAVNKMKEEGTRFIISHFPQYRKAIGMDDFSTAPPLLGFFFKMMLRMRLRLDNLKAPGKEGSRVPDFLNCFCFNDEKHINHIIKLSMENPDPFINELLPLPEYKKERELYYRETLFNFDNKGKCDCSPDYSTVVYDKSGNCVAYLLCRQDGFITGLKISKNAGMHTGDLLRCLINRLLENIDYKSISEININYFEKDGKMIKWLKKCGFREADEFPVWGWNEDI